LVRSCTFHPGYGYEDFIEGYRPHTSASGQLVFQLKNGAFKRLCIDAAQEKGRDFFLLVDEINRGDIPRIFGELITLIEFDKRGKSLHLPVSGEQFAVPQNIFIIGTMNTADRSIALLDTALRRRFGFIELLPNLELLKGAVVGSRVPLAPLLSALNDRIRRHVGRDARNLQIGHAYFLKDDRPIIDIGHFTRVFAEDIVPLLEEYCYGDYGALAAILGSRLVDVNTQRINDDLFSPDRRDDLISALLIQFAEVATSSEALQLPDTDQEREPEGEPEAEPS
jgi:5-methylcytosine-specific restriction protein B